MVIVDGTNRTNGTNRVIFALPQKPNKRKAENGKRKAENGKRDPPPFPTTDSNGRSRFEQSKQSNIGAKVSNEVASIGWIN